MAFEVSVIIPVFNREKFIERAIMSAVTLECVKEIIVIDDGSTDSSFSICQHLSSIYPKIRVLSHAGHKNKGVSASRNLGIASAKSAYIAFLDSDDYYLPNRFDFEIKLSEDIGIFDGVYGAANYHNTTTNDNTLYTIKQIIEPEKLFKALLWQDKGLFCTPTITIRKDVFKTVGYFDPKLKVAEDTDLWLRLSAYAKILSGSINNALCIVDLHDNNTKNTNAHLYEESYKYIFNKLLRKILFSPRIAYNNKNELLLAINHNCKIYPKVYSESRFLTKILAKHPILFFCPAIYHKIIQMILK
ncbi:MAG: glycosyltransferase [Bacteroidales bacterium]|nr:glycosyltransferase [Bacteroidales bacterium]